MVFKKKVSDKQIREIKELYGEGISMNKIKDKFKLSNFTIYSIVKDNRDNNRKKEIDSFIKNLNNLSDYNKGYIAGILDGEGCILIHTAKNKDKDKVYYSAMINFSNQDKLLLDYIKDTLKLSTKIAGYNESPTGTCYLLNIYGKDMIKPFLKWIIPYSKSIKTQNRAKIMLDFCDAKDQETRKRLWLKMKITNFNGKPRKSPKI
jgi:hypothetical protein